MISIDLMALQARVLKVLDEYVYDLPPTASGTPLPHGYISGHLVEMRRSLISPYLVPIKMGQPFPLIGSDIWEEKICAIVADDQGGNLLFYDANTNNFGIAMRIKGVLRDIGIPGDAVGCFIAR